MLPQRAGAITFLVLKKIPVKPPSRCETHTQGAYEKRNFFVATANRLAGDSFLIIHAKFCSMGRCVYGKQRTSEGGQQTGGFSKQTRQNRHMHQLLLSHF